MGTTDEIKECLKDLKVLGMKELRMLKKWKDALKKEFDDCDKDKTEEAVPAILQKTPKLWKNTGRRARRLMLKLSRKWWRRRRGGRGRWPRSSTRLGKNLPRSWRVRTQGRGRRRSRSRLCTGR